MTWRARGAAAGVVLLALVGSFAAGRYTRAARVVTVDKVRVEYRDVEKIRTVAVHDQAAVKDTAEKAKTVTVVKYRWLPGGTVEATQTTQAATEATAHETKQERAGATSDVLRAAEALRDETHVTERTERPQWAVTALVGVQDGGSRLITAIPAPVVAGVVLERRILGPISAGVWATTAKAAGLAVRVDF